MSALGKLVTLAIGWAPAVVRAVKVWVSPAERDAQKRHEQVERDRAKRERELQGRRP